MKLKPLQSVFIGTVLIFILSTTVHAQIGINTLNPQGALDVTSTNNTGLVLPRVTDVESVTDGNGNPPVDGTTVFDLSRGTTCFYQNSEWMCITYDSNGNVSLENVTHESPYTFVKASNTNSGDQFGTSISISNDGSTLAVGTFAERSNAIGINGNQNNNSFSQSGAVYVFNRIGDIWSQQAYIKASNTGIADRFGVSLSLSNDGNTLVVGAIYEASSATGINGNQNDNSFNQSGAVYVFSRTGVTWAQQEYIKASNTSPSDGFGFDVVISGDGNTIVVGSPGERSNATGINGNQNDNSLFNSGAAYVFVKTGVNWIQQEYIKSSNNNIQDRFSTSIDISDDGNTLVIGAPFEASNATGINGNQNDNSFNQSGAAYVFTRTASTWTQESYLKASNTEAGDHFGESVAISGDGNTIIIAATEEDSNASGINGIQNDNSSNDSGAVYVFIKTGITWSQQAYLKASNTDSDDHFGAKLSITSDGNALVVGVQREDSNGIGINGIQNTNSISSSGAAYIFIRTGIVWNQQSYLKASSIGSNDFFGSAISISNNGLYVAVGAGGEDSSSEGINGTIDDLSPGSGAVYILNRN